MFCQSCQVAKLPHPHDISSIYWTSKVCGVAGSPPTVWRHLLTNCSSLWWQHTALLTPPPPLPVYILKLQSSHALQLWRSLTCLRKYSSPLAGNYFNYVNSCFHSFNGHLLPLFITTCLSRLAACDTHLIILISRPLLQPLHCLHMFLLCLYPPEEDTSVRIPNRELPLHILTPNVSLGTYTSGPVMCDQPEDRKQHTSNLLALSVTRYWFGSLPDRMMICVCLVWLTDKGNIFFFSPLHLLRLLFHTLVPSMPDILPVIPHPFQVTSGVKTDLEREAGRQGGRERLRHGMKIRVIVFNRQCLSPNPWARWPLSAREMANPPDSHVQIPTRMNTHSLNMML